MIKRFVSNVKLAKKPQSPGLASSIPQMGFTMVELLAVIAIMAILAIAAIPAIQGLLTSKNFYKSIHGIADSLNLARTYAMAQHTYVYIGLTEVDRNQNPSASPQVAGTGRVAVAIVATKDGTSDNAASSTWTTNYSNGAGLVLVNRLQTFDSLHLTTGFANPASGNMARPDSSPLWLSSFSSPSFSFPLGGALDAGQYDFSSTTSGVTSGVICFNPEGQVILNGGTVSWIEIDLQPAHGNQTPPPPVDPNKGEQAAIVIDGMTGVTSIYQP